MKRIGTTVSMLVLAGSLTGSAFAANDVFVKDEGANSVIVKDRGVDGYCHEQFPAIRSSTLGTDEPELKSSNTGDMIDFYGSCDENPTGADQVKAQELEQEHRLDSH